MRVRQNQVVCAAGIGRALHTELAGGVAIQEIALHHAFFYYRTCAGGHAFRIEIAAVQAARNVRFFAQIQMGRQNGFAQAVAQEAGLAVQRRAAQSADQMPDKAACNCGIEHDGILAGGQAAGIQPPNGTLRSGAADVFCAFQILRAAGHVKPVIALHAVAVVCHEAARNAVARAFLVLAEAVRVGINKLVMRNAEVGAVRIDDAAVGFQTGLFALLGKGNGFFAAQIPFVVFVQIAHGFSHQIGICQTGVFVFGGVSRNVAGSLHGCFQCLRRQIGRTGTAFALPEIYGDVQRFVLLVLDLLDFLQADAHRLPQRFAHVHFGRTGAFLPCQRQNGLGGIDKLCACMLKHIFHLHESGDIVAVFRAYWADWRRQNLKFNVNFGMIRVLPTVITRARYGKPRRMGQQNPQEKTDGRIAGFGHGADPAFCFHAEENRASRRFARSH